MTAEAELSQIATKFDELQGKFFASVTQGAMLSVADEATFKSLAVQAKAILDDVMGPGNDFSIHMLRPTNMGSAGIFGPVTQAAVAEAAQLLRGAVEHLQRRSGIKAGAQALRRTLYVDVTRLAELRRIRSNKFDLSRLIRLCEELNVANELDCHMSVAMLVRAILDHVPPIFGSRSFAEVANNTALARSPRGSLVRLDSSLRHIADAHLHVQIRPSEVLPAAAQVDFRADLDVLLGEVVRLLK